MIYPLIAIFLTLSGCLQHTDHEQPHDAELAVGRFHTNLVLDCLNGTVIYLPARGKEYELRCEVVTDAP